MFTEYNLASKGFSPTVIDSDDLWLQQRVRASKLGSHALILIGASRSQLDLDLTVLRQKTGLEPVQLSMDGTSFVPTLLGLAEDTTITGTVLIDFYFDQVLYLDQAERGALVGARQEAAYKALKKSYNFNYLTIENKLKSFFNSRLANYADNFRPMDTLFLRVLDDNIMPSYLTTFADRSRKADYTKVTMLDFYLTKAAVHLGLGRLDSKNNIEKSAIIRNKIDQLEPASVARYYTNFQRIESAIRTIEARGGRVIIARFPVSGLVKEAEDKLYPRAQFWDVLRQKTQAKTFHFEDWPETAHLVCPDGSHLDYRDQVHFTQALVQALGLTDQ